MTSITYQVWWEKIVKGLVLKTKTPSVKKGFKGGPNWARTSDPLIMSQML